MISSGISLLKIAAGICPGINLWNISPKSYRNSSRDSNTIDFSYLAGNSLEIHSGVHIEIFWGFPPYFLDDFLRCFSGVFSTYNSKNFSTGSLGKYLRPFSTCLYRYSFQNMLRAFISRHLYRSLFRHVSRNSFKNMST